ncbi:MAG: DUF2023 family protein [Candidatus Gastranaerophilales bacterium]|nr:DUF2023 family protein [Candidatus Gastranaerophilales bacterium]
MKILAVNTKIQRYNNFSKNQTSPILSRKEADTVIFQGNGAMKIGITDPQNTVMPVFNHHIYELKKGLRRLALLTEKPEKQSYIEHRLQKEDISYVINKVNESKINIFFGDNACIDVVKGFDSQLNKLTPEQDFMLGTMLGYDVVQQCERYQKMKNKIVGSMPVQIKKIGKSNKV